MVQDKDRVLDASHKVWEADMLALMPSTELAPGPFMHEVWGSTSQPWSSHVPSAGGQAIRAMGS